LFLELLVLDLQGGEAALELVELLARTRRRQLLAAQHPAFGARRRAHLGVAGVGVGGEYLDRGAALHHAHDLMLGALASAQRRLELVTDVARLRRSRGTKRRRACGSRVGSRSWR